VVQPEVLDLNATIHDLVAMLRRLIGEDIALELELPTGLPAIKADRGHLTQIIMNLAVNARDAMPRGGTLRVSTSVVALDDAQVARIGTSGRGDHVRMTVEDTGHGMDESTMRRIFEPFFTTKAIGKGTGLGLATVYGIVKQAGGGIDVQSQPGRGSTFSIFLPVTAADAGQARPAPASADQGGGETVLVVEDEDAVRSLVARVLRSRGYRVLEAASGTLALAVVDAHIGAIDLILTDVIMPGMSGPELVRRLIAERPALRVIYMSGYTQDEVLHHGVRQDTASFLEKPMTPGGLAAKVREVLDSQGSEGFGESAA
jgi:CheY-like chemotaxis protein